MRKIFLFKETIILLFISVVGFVSFKYGHYQEVYKDSGVNNNIEFYKTPGKCMGTYKYKIVEPQTHGYALAVELRRLEFAPLDSPTTNLVMLYNPHYHSYYRDQVITIPKDSCARLVGVWKYGSSETSQRITPLVQIMSR